MHETKEICEKLDCTIKQLACYIATATSECISLERIATQDYQYLTDSIEDLASTKKNLMKSCYYEAVIEAMKEYEEDGDGSARHHYPRRMRHYDGIHPYPYDDDPMMDVYWDPMRHYDHWRYSSGRFAPEGHGHRSKSYVPSTDPMMDMQHEGHRWSTHLDKYRDARRHYTETHSPEDKHEMDEHSRHHMNEAIESMEEILVTADPALKQDVKKNLMSLLNAME